VERESSLDSTISLLIFTDVWTALIKQGGMQNFQTYKTKTRSEVMMKLKSDKAYRASVLRHNGYGFTLNKKYQ